MFQPYKGRRVYRGQKIHVYRNLHNGLMSIRDAHTGLVLGHAASVVLRDAVYHVNQSGRARVLRERKKYVHAWVEGQFETTTAMPVEGLQPGTYNPFAQGYFLDARTGEPLLKQYSRVVATGNKTYYQPTEGARCR